MDNKIVLCKKYSKIEIEKILRIMEWICAVYGKKEIEKGKNIDIYA